MILVILYMELGKLENVELREIWKHEALDFTKWLAKKENIALLSKEIGINIEVIDTEMSVGRYNVDIYAKDSNSNKKIIIENQLENTNHDHLGKVIVYSAGLDADIAIWVVKDVNEEHKQAVEWLNENSFEKINIFLVKVELWKIGNSPIAPKFQIVCEPNNWSKLLKQKSEDELCDRKLEQLKFWQGFVDYSKDKEKEFTLTKPLLQNWYSISVGSSDYKICLVYNISVDGLKCQFEVSNKDVFKKLEQYKNEIDMEISNLEWDYLEERKTDKIILNYGNKVSNDIDSAYAWLLNSANKFKEVFLKYINK